MSKNIIEVKNLTKTFNNFTAVNSINFEIKRGEILALLGPNGAGKTTTIKMIIGLLSITRGDIFFNGKNITKNIYEIRPHIGYMSQKFSLYPELTGLQNIEFFAGARGLKKREVRIKCEEAKDIIGMEYINKKVLSIPPGIRQKIAMINSLINDPKIVFLDEPTSGVDPQVRRNFWQEIYELKNKGKTLLVSTHNLDEAEYADRIIILHRGNIIVEGEINDLYNEFGLNSIEEIFKEAILNEKVVGSN